MSAQVVAESPYALVIEVGQQELETLVFLADDILDRHAHVLKVDESGTCYNLPQR